VTLDTVSGKRVDVIRVYNYPDGGISRVRAFEANSLPKAEEAKFHHAVSHLGERHEETIPPVVKDIETFPIPSENQVSQNWVSLLNRIASLPLAGNAAGRKNIKVDVACNEYGGSVVAVSNQHYGPASAVLSSSAPRGMFDGFETSRSRASRPSPPLDGVHHAAQWLEIKFGKASCIHEVEVDFSYFVCNNPLAMAVELYDGIKWHVAVPRTVTKPYAGNRVRFVIPAHLSEVVTFSARVFSYPCGGYNRIHFYSHFFPRIQSNL
jgi:allantoicase